MIRIGNRNGTKNGLKRVSWASFETKGLEQRLAQIRMNQYNVCYTKLTVERG